MKGLDVAEIHLSELENEMTIGAEYYSLNFLNSYTRILSSGLDCKVLSKCCSLITDGDHGSADYQETGVPFILSEAVQEGWINTDKLRYISKAHSETLKRSELRPGNVLLTKTGIYFGKSAVLPESIPVANTIAHVGKLVPHKWVNPYYLSTFLNSSYGYLQLRRRGIKATRPEMKLVEMQDILIAFASEEIQLAVEQLVRKGIDTIKLQADQYAQAETLLLDALGLANWQPVTPLAYEQSSIVAFTRGRFDAEYYQPKHEALLAHLKSHAPRLRRVGEFAVKCKRGELPVYDDEGKFSAITSKHILENGLDYDNFERTNKIALDAKVQLYDVLTYMTGANVGRTAVLLEDITAQVSGDVNILRLEEENPVYVAVVLNSLIGRQQTYRTVTGSAQAHLYSDDIADFLVPFVAAETQAAIVAAVETAHTARYQAKRLLEAAKRAVEVAIEEGNAAALAYLETIQAS